MARAMAYVLLMHVFEMYKQRWQCRALNGIGKRRYESPILESAEQGKTRENRKKKALFPLLLLISPANINFTPLEQSPRRPA